MFFKSVNASPLNPISEEDVKKLVQQNLEPPRRVGGSCKKEEAKGKAKAEQAQAKGAKKGSRKAHRKVPRKEHQRARMRRVRARARARRTIESNHQSNRGHLVNQRAQEEAKAKGVEKDVQGIAAAGVARQRGSSSECRPQEIHGGLPWNP